MKVKIVLELWLTASSTFAIVFLFFSFYYFKTFFHLVRTGRKNATYSGDLNSEHLNSRNIWITNFHLFATQMPSNRSSHDLNNKPFKERTVLDHLNTKLVRYSDHSWLSGVSREFRLIGGGESASALMQWSKPRVGVII